MVKETTAPKSIHFNLQQNLSPDMNPTEYIWVIFYCKISKIFKEEKERKKTIKEDLLSVFNEHRSDIPQNNGSDNFELSKCILL